MLLSDFQAIITALKSVPDRYLENKVNTMLPWFWPRIAGPEGRSGGSLHFPRDPEGDQIEAKFFVDSESEQKKLREFMSFGAVNTNTDFNEDSPPAPPPEPDETR